MRRKDNVVQAVELVQQLDEESEPSSSAEDSSLSDAEVEDETLAPRPDSEEEDEVDELGEEMEFDTEQRERDTSPLWISSSGITWSPMPDIRLPFYPPAIRRPGITRYAVNRIHCIEDSFDFFLTKDILNIIIRHTNAEGRRRSASWIDVDAVELRAFFGLLILAGVYRSRGEATKNLWGEETGRAIFRATMSLKRFTVLTATIRFDDQLTRSARQLRQPDKLAPLREVWDLWVARLPLAYNPDRDVCVDKQLIRFRGRCSFAQFVPSNPAKYGLKMWVMCDVGSSYVWGMRPSLEKGTLDTPAEREQRNQVVLELTERLSGHTVTTNKDFTSVALGEELLKKNVCLVGMVRHKKPELPRQLLQTSGRAALSSVFCFNSTTTSVSYVPKLSPKVILISTKHQQAEIQEDALQTPTILLDYNHCQQAVDNLHKLITIYTCSRQTRRWPMALFSYILDVSAYNALVLWLSVKPTWSVRKKSFQRRLFLEELGRSLVRPAMAERTRLPRTSGAVSLVQLQQLEAVAVQDQKKKCHLCKGKRSLHARVCSKCGQGVCKEHITVICFACTH